MGRTAALALLGASSSAGGQAVLLTHFAGVPSQPAAGKVVAFKRITAVRFVEPDAAMGSLNQTWLVGDAEGLKQVYTSGRGWLLPGTEGQVTAVATRPLGSTEDNPRHVVFAQVLEGASRATALAAMQGQIAGPSDGVVMILDPDGSTRILAGGRRHDPHEPGFKDGTGPEARFGRITGLAMAKDGTVFVADEGNLLIRRIAPDGRVSTLAGQLAPRPWPHPLNPRDGLGSNARFCLLGGMAMDPATGDLLVSEGNAIRKVTPAGEVSTLLGRFAKHGFAGSAPTKPVAGTPCLYFPLGLQCDSGLLFIADRHNNAIRIFDLGSRELDTLVGDPTQRRTRLGPVRFFSPDLSVDEGAAVTLPNDVAINADGICLVALEHGLLEINLKLHPDHAAGGSPKRQREDEEDGANGKPPTQAAAASAASALDERPKPKRTREHEPK